MAWVVRGSKKGALEVVVEKRPKGKKATCIGHVEGDAQSLLLALKERLGAGGVVVVVGSESGSGSTRRVEVQGDHAASVLAYLSAHPDQLRGVAGVRAGKEAAARALAAASAARIAEEEAEARRELRRETGKARHTHRTSTRLAQEVVDISGCVPEGAELLPWSSVQCCPMDWVYCSNVCRVRRCAGDVDLDWSAVFWDEGARVVPSARAAELNEEAFDDLSMVARPAAVNGFRSSSTKARARREAHVARITQRREAAATLKGTATAAPAAVTPPAHRPTALFDDDDEVLTYDDVVCDPEDYEDEELGPSWAVRGVEAAPPLLPPPRNTALSAARARPRATQSGPPPQPPRRAGGGGGGGASRVDGAPPEDDAPLDWALEYAAVVTAALEDDAASSARLDWTIADEAHARGMSADDAALEALRVHLWTDARKERRYDTDGAAYTREEFFEYYGDDRAWLDARKTAPPRHKRQSGSRNNLSAPPFCFLVDAAAAQRPARVSALVVRDEDDKEDALRATLELSHAETHRDGGYYSSDRGGGGEDDDEEAELRAALSLSQVDVGRTPPPRYEDADPVALEAVLSLSRAEERTARAEAEREAAAMRHALALSQTCPSSSDAPPSIVPDHYPAPSSFSATAALWTCATCTFANAAGAAACDVCGAARAPKDDGSSSLRISRTPILLASRRFFLLEGCLE